MKGEERRKHIRIFLPGGQVRMSSGMILVLVGRVIDISTGGLKFICSTDLEIGSEIDLEIIMPTGAKFKSLVGIVHVERFKEKENESLYGARFIDLGSRERAELGEYVMGRLGKQEDVSNNGSGL